MRQYAAKTVVARSTLLNRLSGAKSHREAHDTGQKVPPELEAQLVEWILAEDRAGEASESVRMRTVAEEMLTAAVLPTGFGERRYLNFIHRHDITKAVYARKIKADRITAATSEKLMRFSISTIR